MRLIIIAIILLITVLGISTQTKAQNIKGMWNIREKDSLLEYASQEKYYKGVIWDYSSTMHELIPKRDDTYDYIRTSKYKKTHCTYEAANAEELVIQIFADFSNFNNSPANCQTTDLENYNSFRMVGKDKEKMVGYHITADENYQTSMTMNYINIHSPNEIVKSMASDSIKPIAQLNDAIVYAVMNSESLLLEKKGKYSKISGITKKQLKWNENFYQDVVIGKNKFYLQQEEEEDEFKIISIDPLNGNISTVVEDGFAPRFYNDHLYFMSGNGLIKLNTENKTTTQVLTYDQVEAINVKPNYTLLEDQLIWGNENIFIAKIEFLQAFNFRELNEVKGRLSELRDQLDDLGFEEHHLLDPVAESEDAPSKVKFLDLPENEQRLINAIKELRAKRKNIQMHLNEQMKAGVMAGNSRRGLLPEEYKLMQHPVTREPIFVTDQLEWPVYTPENIIFLPSAFEK